MNSSETSTPPQAAKVMLASRIDSFLQKHHFLIVICLCVYASLRILIFSAVFPLFNSTDEPFHFDLVHKYSRGYRVVKDLPLMDSETARILALYGSSEYLTAEEDLRLFHMDRPIAQLPPALKAEKYQHWFAYWTKRINVEANSPPGYYAVASVWYKFGSVLGFTDWQLAYWVRFLNAIVYALLVWFSYVFVRKIYPERGFLYLAVPALIAVFPQDVFFGMNRGVLSPLFGAIAMILLFRVLQKETLSYSLLVSSALWTGLASLIDISNWVFLVALVLVLSARFGRKHQEPLQLSAFSIATFAAIVPPVIWMAHNYLVLGDLTGSGAKVQALGWSLKPLHETIQHPIFSWHGLVYFFSALMRTYWRGEYRWHGVAMRLAVSDWFYVVSSYLMIGVFAVHLFRRRKAMPELQRLSGVVALCLLMASGLFLVVISLLFDFHDCIYPSRLYPYFVSGRIVSGTLLPFAIIYAIGLETLLARARNRVHPTLVLAAIMLFVTVSEVIARKDVLDSPFSLFALVRERCC